MPFEVITIDHASLTEKSEEVLIEITENFSRPTVSRVNKVKQHVIICLCRRWQVLEEQVMKERFVQFRSLFRL